MTRRNAPPPPTAWHTIGPFFPCGLAAPALAVLTREGQAGEAIILEGQVEDGAGPFSNAIVEISQADAAGHLPGDTGADPDFAFWGRAATDGAGRFAFRTLRPGRQADQAGPRAPVFDVALIGSGIMRRLLTSFFLPGDAANATDPVWCAVPARLRPRLLLEPRAARDGLPVFHAAIRLKGLAATPFFRD